MKVKARVQYSDLKLDGLKTEKSQQNTFLTLRNEIMKKRLFHN